MKKKLSLIVLAVSLVGCSNTIEEVSVPTVDDCFDQGLWLYDGQCTDWLDIPQDDKEQVINDAADGIAEAQGITREQALTIMMGVIKQVMEENAQ